MDLVHELEPLLNEHGYKFESGNSGTSSGGAYANGYFVNDKVRIGFIFRGMNLGLIIYETTYSNIGHDSIFSHLGKPLEQELLYNSSEKKSYARKGRISSAILSDLNNHILPYFRRTGINEINAMIKNERKKIML